MPKPTEYETHFAAVEGAANYMRRALQGHGPEFATSFPVKPQNAHPAGALFPDPLGGTVREIEEEYGRVSYTPTAMGVKVNIIDTQPVPTRLRVRCGLYYPVKPTHAEAKAWLEGYARDADELHFPFKYRRVELEVWLDAEFPLDGDGNFAEHSDASRALQAALDAAAAKAAADPDIAEVGKGGGGGATLECTRDDLLDPTKYAALLSDDKPAEPHWEAQIHHRVVQEGDARFLEVLVHNSTPKQPDRYEIAFIGVQFTLEASAKRLHRFQLRELEARDYRYDATTWANGRNAYAEGHQDGDRVTVETDSVPVYRQKRLRQQSWPGPGGAMDLRFDTLASDPQPTLLAVLAAMKEYERGWMAKANDVPAAATEVKQVADGLAAFRQEMERYERGLAALADASAMAGFRLMNKAFADRFRRTDPTGNGKWRLFQLVFVVSEAADLVDRHLGRCGATGPAPTVLWFPTGGGKTEAYLGLVIWHAFWDRLRGKPYGVTSIAKFPLRMLSLQQFSRVVAVMEHAEDVRTTCKELEGKRGDSFSVGYYAGGGNSENLIDWPVSPDGTKRSEISQFLKAKLRRGEDRAKIEALHRKVPTCPMCGGQVRTAFNEAKPGFDHECTTCKRRLNLHLSDTEVLRRLPTLIIATVDKLARFAYEHWGRSLFGDVAAVCNDHGYLIAIPDGGRCPVMACQNTLSKPPPNVDPVPTLLVQDELHVLEESLGAMASHYETTLLDTLRRKPGKGPWKIVGSTATIEGYQYLVRQLYNHGRSVRFPAIGPTAKESFYVAQTDEEQRLVLGVRTHGMSHVDATMRTFLEYHRAMAPAFDPANCKAGVPATLRHLSPDELATFGRYHRTVIGYGINKNEVSQVARSFAGQLSPYCQREGLVEFEDDRVELLTGDTPMEALQQWLEDTERGVEPYCQAASVTSLFALGVDIPWLNMIVFRGMPHGMAEYIQAMSRVGRKEGVPSIVVNVYNPNRERDASHFEAHNNFLEFAGVLIRNVPTTRFSLQALELTLPGVFMHQVNYHNPVKDIWKKQSVAGAGAELRDREAHYRDHVMAALGIVDAPDPQSSQVLRQREHAEIILGKVKKELLKRTAGVNPIQESAKDRLHIPNSLRTTDETIRVYSNGRVKEDA